MSRKDHRSSLFLMELIIAIFFFSLAAAVCIRLYAEAGLTQEETSELGSAVPLAESACSAFRSAGGDLSGLSAAFPEGHLNSDETAFSVAYDEDFRPLGPDDGEEACYTLSVTPKPSGGDSSLLLALVRVSRDNETVCQLTASVQIPRTVPGPTGVQP